MVNTAISVQQLSKCYNIKGKQQRPQETLVGQLAQWVASPFKRANDSAGVAAKDSLHWALRDLDFEVPEGETVGIIGHNGAGKSTLLKLLSRVTQPTSGKAVVRGRMASLLEVGTGFHPDLSGRDNVLLNGSILGMSRRHIAQRFDAIVDFSGVEDYIDTPIKYYSSGMKVRLAFAVAAHLEPDILVVDEVLAVGDAAFQKKCLNRIEEVGSSGRTVLYVSHQLTTVARLCSHAIVLNHGQKVFDGAALEGIRYYTEQLGFATSRRHWADSEEPQGDSTARLHSAELFVDGELIAAPVSINKGISVVIDYTLYESNTKLTPSIHLADTSGTWVFSAIDLEKKWHNKTRPAGRYQTRVEIPANYLNEGTFTISVALATLEPLEQHCYARDCVGFTVYDPMLGDSARGEYQGEFPGIVRPILNWQTQGE
ncbi:MAG: ABC transporter ATP-binding protein [Oceanococcus sp.]